MASKWIENYYLLVILWILTFKMAKNGQNAPKMALWFLFPQNLLNMFDLPVQYIKCKKKFYRPIKNRLVMVLHLGTKKIYFGQKEPKYFKKSQNQLIDYLEFCRGFYFKFSMIKIFLWTKTVLYRLFPIWTLLYWLC